MSNGAAPSNAIQISLSDQSGLDSSVATAWVAGWINGGSSSFQVLQSDGSFGAAATQSTVLQANQAWQSTGITLVQGACATLTVSRTSGTWTADPNTNNGQLYDANGCPGVVVPAGRTSFPIVGVQMGALVGRIGGGTPFLVGDGPLIIDSTTAGLLELCINDDLTGAYGAGLTDNSGSITVEIAQGLAFFAVSSIAAATFATATNGNDRLLFVVSPAQPDDLPIAAAMPMQYTSYPFANSPGIAAPGPFDVFEFGFDAQADLSAVNGFGLNLSFSYGSEQFGANVSYSRQQIGAAYSAFITHEAQSNSSASAYAELLYNGAIGTGAYTPPAIGGQFFAIADPGDMLVAKGLLNPSTAASDALASYWDSTLAAFFKVGNYLSINLSAGSTNIYSGQSSLQKNPLTGVTAAAFTLTNSTTSVSYTFYQPPAGLAGAQYVFQQAFGDLTPAGAGGDAGLLQDSIWEALCRGVATDGVFTTSKTNGESTTHWNDASQWYAAGSVCNLYAKFLHYSTITGTDCRTIGSNGKPGTPILYGNAAYGFSMDENPLGPYSGPNVPSKTIDNVPAGSTLALVIGPWA
jgi:hypothetical protein